MNYLRLLWLFLRVGVLNEFAYRKNFFIQLLYALTVLGTALGSLAVVFSHTDNLGGWGPNELLVVIGIYTILRAAIEMTLEPSLESFMEDVRRGSLDFTLVKPVDAQFLVSIRHVSPWKLIDVGLGLGVLAVALLRLQSAITLWQTITFAGMMLSGGIIIYSFLLILATCSFWFIRVDNLLVIFMSVYTAGRWPVSIYPFWLRTTLSFLVPVLFAITVPAEALVGRLTEEMLLLSIGMALFLLLGSRLFWKVGMRHYSGASA